MLDYIDGNIIDGKKFSEKLYKLAEGKLSALKQKFSTVPGLAIIRVGDDEASKVYVANKLRQAQKFGMQAVEYVFPADISQKILNAKIENLNNDHRIHGIIVQLPLPDHLDKSDVINMIDPQKDVDGFGVVNVGKLHTWQDCLEPCTPTGIVMLLKSIYRNQLAGLRTTIIGRSDIVGKPLAAMLLREDCTVKILHSHTLNIKEETQDCDVLISAVGNPKFIDEAWVSEGCCVIDIGITRAEDGKLCGDIDFDSVKEKASFITPVPGGVGPITVACLLLNTVKAACIQKKIKIEDL